MSDLADKQARFTHMVGKMLALVERLEHVRARIDYVRRCDTCQVGHPNSLHKKRLAVDVLIDTYQDGQWKYRPDAGIYETLGLYWESLGGSWGGRFTSPDSGHFSLKHEGIK